MAQSVFRSWTKPEDALSKITERIEADLGDGENDVEHGFGVAAAPVNEPAGSAAYRANFLYVERRNHWQRGRTWPVHYPNQDIRKRQLEKIAPMFCSVPAINKAVTHQRDALLGREATITLEALEPVAVPGDDSDEPARAAAQEAKARQDAERDEALRVLSAWWDSVGLWETMRSAAVRAAWACRGPIRVRVLPSGMVDDETMRADLEFADALSRVALYAVLPDRALVYTDGVTQETACIIRFKEEAGPAAEVWFREEGRTFRMILHAGENKEPTVVPVDGLDLPLQEVTGELLVTSSAREQQAQLNYTKTKLTRVIQTASDRERFASNIEEPGTWSLTPPPAGVRPITDTDAEGNTIYFYPGPWETGPETISVVQGRVVPSTAEGGEDQILTPAIQVVDPVNPQYLTDALNAEEATLLRSVGQGHTVTLAKATSGEEKKQDRAEFKKQVDSYKQSIENATAGRLTAAVRAALKMTRAGDPWHGFFDRWRITCTLHIDTGPLSAEEQRQEVELYEKGLKPRPDVMAAVAQVEDPGAADAAMAADPVQRAARLKSVFEVAKQLRDDFSLGAALQYVKESGLASPALLAALGRTDYADGEQ